MADIVHRFRIRAPAADVFRGISTPQGLDAWWSKHAEGSPREGGEYALGFGPAHQWRAVVVRCVPPTDFELRMIRADDDWLGTRVGFRLDETNGVTWVRFHHAGWPDANEHHEVSSFCWAMYLRLLRRHVETGDVVPYETRLDA